MHIIALLFFFLFFGCEANINSFNVDINGDTSYAQSDTNQESSGSATENTTNNSNTQEPTTDNTNTTTNVDDDLGTQTSTFAILEVSSGSGIPVTGGESFDIEVYSSYLVFRYSLNLTKVKYSNDISSISTTGTVSGKVARVPNPSKFIKIYFNSDGDEVSKIFEVTLPSNSTLPK
mgnify:CR=1 FL=1